LSFYREIYLQKFFSGLFFKRISNNVLNLPSSSYKDRFKECENCEIARYVVKKWPSGLMYLSDFFVATAADGERIKIVHHRIGFFGDCILREWVENEISNKEKRLLEVGRDRFHFTIEYEDKRGMRWSQDLFFNPK